MTDGTPLGVKKKKKEKEKSHFLTVVPSLKIIILVTSILRDKAFLKLLYW